MPRSKLNRRQRLVRKRLVASHGTVSSTELAEEFDVDRTTIWRDKQIIAKVRPIEVPQAELIEKDELARALTWFDETEEQLMCELQDNDREIEERRGTSAAIPFLNVRCNLLGQLRAHAGDRRSFLLSVGLLTEAPKTLRWEDALAAIRAAKGLPDRPNPFKAKATDGGDDVDD